MRDEAIKISIIVPIYNVEDYVKPCIESIIGQTYRNLEIILIVDDSSTDHCAEICDYYATKDKRINVVHVCNVSLLNARNAGFAVATGDYVLCVDGDDWIEKDRVEVLVREGILPSHADMIYLSGYKSDFGGKSTLYSFDVPTRLFRNDEIENEVFPLISKESEDGVAFSMDIKASLWMWAIRRDLLLKSQTLIDDRITWAEDFLSICFYLMDAKSVMTIQQDGYHYLQRTSSSMYKVITSSERNFSPIKIWYQVMKKQLDRRHASKKIQKAVNQLTIYFIMNHNNYHLLLQKFSDYIFPYPNVNNSARIVVYGAGKFGYVFVNSLDQTKRCSVVLWVDQNQDRPAVPGYTISSRDAIFTADYDFIVVAIMNADVAREVKRSLILDGIPEEKIALMDASVITEDAIPDEIKDF